MSCPRLAHCRIFKARSIIPPRAIPPCGQAPFFPQILAWPDPAAAPGPPSGRGWGARRRLCLSVDLAGSVLPSGVSVEDAGIVALDSEGGPAGAQDSAGPGLVFGVEGYTGTTRGGVGPDTAITETRPAWVYTAMTTFMTTGRLAMMIPRRWKIIRPTIKVRQASRTLRTRVALNT